MNTALNLLPWRARRRQRRWRHSLWALVLSTLAGGLAWWWLDRAAEAALDAQRQHNHSLSGQLDVLRRRLAELEQHARQQRALASQRALRERERLALLRLLDALARQTPDGVVLAEVRQQGQALSLSARAANSAQISRAMQQWETPGAGTSTLAAITATVADGDAFTLSLPWPVADTSVQFAHMESTP